MRKALSFAVVLVFAWIQGYQLCDQGEDLAEFFGNHSPAIAQASAGAATLSAPDQDPDSAIPLVVGQTLTAHKFGFERGLAVYDSISVVVHPIAVFTAVSSTTDRSPPGDWLSWNSPVTSLALDRSPAHCLAPPLA